MKTKKYVYTVYACVCITAKYTSINPLYILTQIHQPKVSSTKLSKQWQTPTILFSLRWRSFIDFVDKNFHGRRAPPIPHLPWHWSVWAVTCLCSRPTKDGLVCWTTDLWRQGQGGTIQVPVVGNTKSGHINIYIYIWLLIFDMTSFMHFNLAFFNCPWILCPFGFEMVTFCWSLCKSKPSSGTCLAFQRPRQSTEIVDQDWPRCNHLSEWNFG